MSYKHHITVITVARSGSLPLLIASVAHPSDVRMTLALSTVANRNRGVLRHTDILWMRTTVDERSGSRPLLDRVRGNSESHVAQLVDMSHKHL